MSTTELQQRYLAAIEGAVGASLRPLAPRSVIRPAASTELNGLCDLGMPPAMLELFALAVLDIKVDAALMLYPPEVILRYNAEPRWAAFELCQLGFVMIGGSHCGGVYAIDLFSPVGGAGLPRVVLVSHDIPWKDAGQVADASQRRGDSIIEFYEGVAARKFTD